jgi:DnaJ homolog subfamily B member 12
VLGTNNLYSILGLQRNCSDSELKSAYKKLAIKFHPDKNHAPQAAEAFKKVSTAYTCLSDPKSRRQYDLTGREPTSSGRNTPNSRPRHNNEDEDDDINLFDLFFGGGHRPQRRQGRER